VISSVLAKLEPGTSEQDFCARLQDFQSQLEIGDMVGGNGIPLVLDAESSVDMIDLYEQIRNLPGLLSLEVVTVFFEQREEERKEGSPRPADVADLAPIHDQQENRNDQNRNATIQ